MTNPTQTTPTGTPQSSRSRPPSGAVAAKSGNPKADRDVRDAAVAADAHVLDGLTGSANPSRSAEPGRRLATQSPE